MESAKQASTQAREHASKPASKQASKQASKPSSHQRASMQASEQARVSIDSTRCGRSTSEARVLLFQQAAVAGKCANEL
jgi:hypothetical protein